MHPSTRFCFPLLTRKLVQIVLALSLINGVPLVALAQEFEPPLRGMPGRREGGGTRGGCLVGQQSLMALMPESNLSLTVSERPTFFWYIPPTTAEMAEFTLLDARNQEVYKTAVPINQESGIISLQSSEELPALEAGVDYRWYFSLVCDLQDRSADVFTTGWIQRIVPNTALTTHLETVAEVDRPAVYAEAGLWQDALSSLVILRRSQPQDASISRQWTRLLESVELGHIADQPLVPCCQVP